MMRRGTARHLGLLTVLVALAHVAAARADIAPPPTRYVSACTPKDQARPGETCESCAAHYQAVDRCQQQLGARGLERRCRGDGTQTWTEVWCASSGAAASAPPPSASVTSAAASASAPIASAQPSAGGAAEPPSSCSLGSGGIGTSAGLLLSVGVLLLGLRATGRKRARRPG